MCHDLLQAVAIEDLMNNVLFSDEATFNVYGRVNKHICRIWADEQSNATYEWQSNTPKVNVWLGVTATKLYGPFMFREAMSLEPPTWECLDHGCANHDTEGKHFNSPIHWCDATKSHYLFSGELCTSPLHCELLFVYIVCCLHTGHCVSVHRTRNSVIILP